MFSGTEREWIARRQHREEAIYPFIDREYYDKYFMSRVFGMIYATQKAHLLVGAPGCGAGFPRGARVRSNVWTWKFLLPRDQQIYFHQLVRGVLAESADAVAPVVMPQRDFVAVDLKLGIGG
jgi:hypothetical protein